MSTRRWRHRDIPHLFALRTIMRNRTRTRRTGKESKNTITVRLPFRGSTRSVRRGRILIISTRGILIIVQTNIINNITINYSIIISYNININYSIIINYSIFISYSILISYSIFINYSINISYRSIYSITIWNLVNIGKNTLTFLRKFAMESLEEDAQEVNSPISGLSSTLSPPF